MKVRSALSLTGNPAPESVEQNRFSNLATFHLQQIQTVRRCPGGTDGNSPTLQRWVRGERGPSPEGTAETRVNPVFESFAKSLCAWHRHHQ